MKIKRSKAKRLIRTYRKVREELRELREELASEGPRGRYPPGGVDRDNTTGKRRSQIVYSLLEITSQEVGYPTLPNRILQAALAIMEFSDIVAVAFLDEAIKEIKYHILRAKKLGDPMEVAQIDLQEQAERVF